MDKSYHRLLNKQIKKFLKSQSIDPIEIKNFIDSIDETYKSFEENHNQFEKILDISSSELLKSNDKLNIFRNELEKRVDERTYELKSENEKLKEKIHGKKIIEDKFKKSLLELSNIKYALRSSVIYSITDNKGIISYVNDKFCEISGYSRKELIGRDHKLLNSGQHSTEFMKNLWDTLLEGKIWKGEIKNKTKNGNFIWLDTTIIPIKNPENKTYQFLSIRFDITDKKNAEHEIIERKNKYESVVNSVKEVIFQTDKTGLCTFMNPYWTETTGFIIEETIIVDFCDFVYPDDRKIVSKHFSLLLNNNEEHYLDSVRILSKKGGYKWVEINARSTKDENSNILGISGTLTDITEKKKSEQQLRLFESVIINSYDAVLITDTSRNDRASGKIIYANEAFLNIFGYSFEEIHGKTVKLFRGPKTDKDEIRKIDNAVANWKKAEFEIINYKKDGTAIWIDFNIVPITDDTGKFTHWVSVIRDITDRKSAEEELKQANIAAERAVQVKSNFLSNMSHEIRTPLNAIIGLTNLLIQENLELNTIENLKAIKFSADNLLVIVNDILDFAKIDAEKMTFERIDFDINKLIGQVYKITQYEIKDKLIIVEYIIDKKIPPILKGDPVKLNQILLNLTGNAVKFTKSGKIKISVDILESHNDKYNLKFSVTDTGIGISEDNIEHIFDSFTQAYSDISRKFGGTGLGLAISKELVELQGGKLNVVSKLDKGSTFYFNLILDKSDLKNINDENFVFRKNKNLEGTKILFVEDNVMNQFFTQQLLKKWKVSFDTASNGIEAIEFMCKNEYDILLLDIQMPGMNGFEVAKLVRNEKSDILLHNIPIIALTADISFETKQNILASQINDIVLKPIKQDELYNKISYYINKEK
jgi:two-component system, sensor histidine kinase and response regulator